MLSLEPCRHLFLSTFFVVLSSLVYFPLFRKKLLYCTGNASQLFSSRIVCQRNWKGNRKLSTTTSNIHTSSDCFAFCLDFAAFLGIQKLFDLIYGKSGLDADCRTFLDDWIGHGLTSPQMNRTNRTTNVLFSIIALFRKREICAGKRASAFLFFFSPPIRHATAAAHFEHRESSSPSPTPSSRETEEATVIN